MNEMMEELLPIVEGLSRRYTSGDSTSVTYETAQQLMESVAYSIKAASGLSGGPGELIRDNMPLADRYTLGQRRIKERTKEALGYYNRISRLGEDYGNVYLRTTKKELLTFFKHYDPEFNPQEEIVFLDYPVLESVEGLNGIEYIWVYVNSLYRELRFLSKLPQGEVFEKLEAGEKDFRNLPVNLCQVFAEGTFPYERGKQTKLLQMIIDAK